MRDPYQPGHILVLPSGRRVIIQRIWRDELICRYEKARPGDRRYSVKRDDHDLQLTRCFCMRHTHLVPVAGVPA